MLTNVVDPSHFVRYSYIRSSWSLSILPVQSVPITSAGFTYMLDRLKPYKFRGIRLKYIILLTLSLNFHTYAAITHCTLSKQTFSNFPCTVSIPFRILQNLKYPSSPSPLFKLIKHSSIFLYSWGYGEGSSEIA